MVVVHLHFAQNSFIESGSVVEINDYDIEKEIIDFLDAVVVLIHTVNQQFQSR